MAKESNRQKMYELEMNAMRIFGRYQGGHLSAHQSVKYLISYAQSALDRLNSVSGEEPCAHVMVYTFEGWWQQPYISDNSTSVEMHYETNYYQQCLRCKSEVWDADKLNAM